MAPVDNATLREIIVDGDSQSLVKTAQRLGHLLGHPQNRDTRITTAQIRGIFGTVRQLEMDWLLSHRASTSDEQVQLDRRAKRELLLLKPRIAYQAARDQKNGVKALSDVLIPAIDLIQGTSEQERQYFRNFVDFFEAILAYHRANGGKDS